MTMRRNTSLLVLLLAVATSGGVIAGCSDDDPVNAAPKADAGGTTDGPGPGFDAGPGADSGSGGDAQVDTDAGLLFTDYVKDLIVNHTADNTVPDDPEAKTFNPDPEDPTAFPASFFP
jgi:hypothetical protein